MLQVRAPEQRLWALREQASGQRVPQERPLAPKVQVSQERSGLWSWWARPDPDADRAGGPGARCRPAGWGAPHPPGEGRRLPAAAGPVPEVSPAGLPVPEVWLAAAGPAPEALPAEPPVPAWSQEFQRQAIAAGDARARQQGDHGSVHAPERPDGRDARASRQTAVRALREPPGWDEQAWPVSFRRAASTARRAVPRRDAEAGHLRIRLRGSRAACRDRHVPSGLRRAAGAGRAPRTRRGRQHLDRPACAPARPAGVPDLGGRHAVRRRPAGPAVLGGRRAEVPPRHSVRLGPRREASRLPAGGPTRSPAAASGEGRCSQETGWRVSWFSIHH